MDSAPSAELTPGPGGLPSLRLTTHDGVCQVLLHGAHVVSWVPRAHRPVLWLSELSHFANRRPVRGGIPICFPWFNWHPAYPGAPQHGFARLQPWTLKSVTVIGDSVQARLHLTDTDFSRGSIWPFRFAATYSVTVGPELTLEFEVENRDVVPFSYEAALHSYYEVGDVRRTRVDGLRGRPFWNDSSFTGPEAGPIQDLEGVSRRYPAAVARVEDEVNGRALTIRADGATGIVLWNPGTDIARELPDMVDDAWRSMLCLENANLGEDRITLAPGERHRMVTRVSVSYL